VEVAPDIGVSAKSVGQLPPFMAEDVYARCESTPRTYSGRMPSGSQRRARANISKITLSAIP
jgi:hypothetical protein